MNMEFPDLIKSTRPWYVAAPLVGLPIPASLILGSNSFGIGASLRHACAIPLNVETGYGEKIAFQYKTFSKGQLHGGLLFGLGGAIIGVSPGQLFAQIGHGAIVLIVSLLFAVIGTSAYGYFREKLAQP